MTKRPKKTRTWSRTFAGAAIVVPIALYWFQSYRFNQWAASQESGYVCGMPLMAAALLSVVLLGFLSFIAAILGILHYKELAQPRTIAQRTEFILVLLPLVLVLLLSATAVASLLA